MKIILAKEKVPLTSKLTLAQMRKVVLDQLPFAQGWLVDFAPNGEDSRGEMVLLGAVIGNQVGLMGLDPDGEGMVRYWPGSTAGSDVTIFHNLRVIKKLVLEVETE